MLKRAWNYNLTCISLDGGIVLAIPIESFYEILDSDEILDKQLLAKAKKIDESIAN